MHVDWRFNARREARRFTLSTPLENGYKPSMSMLLRLSSLTRILLLLGAVAWFNVAQRAFAQRQQPAPTVLKSPSDWRFERLTIPPGFAPDIKWTGFEE